MSLPIVMKAKRMNRTITAMVAAVAAFTLLPGCASSDDGPRMTLAERWKAMVERQDAAARNFVRTDSPEPISQSHRTQWSSGTLQPTSVAHGM
jgi:hypothetical protein